MSDCLPHATHHTAATLARWAKWRLVHPSFVATAAGCVAVPLAVLPVGPPVEPVAPPDTALWPGPIWHGEIGGDYAGGGVVFGPSGWGSGANGFDRAGGAAVGVGVGYSGGGGSAGQALNGYATGGVPPALTQAIVPGLPVAFGGDVEAGAGGADEAASILAPGSVADLPEPASWLVLMVGLVAVVMWRRA